MSYYEVDLDVADQRPCATTEKGAKGRFDLDEPILIVAGHDQRVIAQIDRKTCRISHIEYTNLRETLLLRVALYWVSQDGSDVGGLPDDCYPLDTDE